MVDRVARTQASREAPLEGEGLSNFISEEAIRRLGTGAEAAPQPQKYFSNPPGTREKGVSGGESRAPENASPAGAERTQDSLSFSHGPADLIQSSLVLHEVVVDAPAPGQAEQRLFQTSRVRSKFAEMKERSRQSFEGDSSGEGRGGSSRGSPRQRSEDCEEELKTLARESRANHRSLRESLALGNSGDSRRWESKPGESPQESSVSRNPFKSSELQRSLEEARAVPSERKGEAGAKTRVLGKSGRGESMNSLIYSNENALKNIIQEHGLNIEESLGKEQLERLQGKEENPPKLVRDSGVQKRGLDVIPESDGRLVFTLKEKPGFQSSAGLQGGSGRRESSGELQSLRVERSRKDPERAAEGRGELEESEVDPEVDYLMEKLAQVMEDRPEPCGDSLLPKEVALNRTTRHVLTEYFRRQDEKSRQNREYLRSTYTRLKGERVHIEDQLKQLGNVYKAQIQKLEKASRQKDQEIKKLRNRNQLLGIQKGRKAPQPKGSSGASTRDKHYSDKVKNLSRLLEEKNRKIQALRSKIEDLKIDNQAMKELLAEFSAQVNA